MLTMAAKKIKLPREDEVPTHRFVLHIPLPIYNRMIGEGGLTWGKVTKFILAAIVEKLDRMKEAK